MYISELRIENFRMFGAGDQALVVPLRPGLTAIVGENDAGKTAVIDALRFALGTTDQDWYRLEDSDFHRCDTRLEVRVVCKFQNLSDQDMRTFVEYLTYGDSDKSEQPYLCINWMAADTGTAPKGRPFRRVEMRSGRNVDGPRITSEVREMLRATYLRPLRDAEFALSAGRGSRLSQVLHRTEDVRDGQEYDPEVLIDPKNLNVRGIGDFANALLQEQEGISATREKINAHLAKLSLHGDELRSNIKVSGTNASKDTRLRQLLEKLDLSLESNSKLDVGKLGLGSNNLLFMACELLLMAQEDEGNKLLLIEEPEAHLHTQRQLQVMKYLQTQSEENRVQVIVTTHSPNLASAISLNNMVMIQNGHAFSLAKNETKLEPSDYRFLERFLDATKANLFFARGVMIVEGDAENILLPTLAKLVGRDFTEYGVSIVNVGGVGLRRYARIFQRNDAKLGQLSIPVACVTDMDVMPDCGKTIIKKELPSKGEIGEAGLAKMRAALSDKTDGQNVKTFIANEWTLEYDLSYFGLAKEVYVAAHLAKKDDALAKKGKDLNKATVLVEVEKAQTEFDRIEQEVSDEISKSSATGFTNQELLATNVYALFTTGTKASKTISVQYLASALEDKKLTHDAWREILPPYLIEAIDYVTGAIRAVPEGGD